MKISYICSPFRAETERQKQKHIEYVKSILIELIKLDTQMFLPKDLTLYIVPHLLYSLVLDDNKIEQRELALKFCFEWIRKSDKIIVGNRYGISEGMKQEIALAEKLGKKIIYLEEANE